MRFVVVFLLVVLVLGIGAALLGARIGMALRDALFPPDVPPQSVGGE